MWKKKEHQEKNAVKEIKRKGYCQTIKNYIETLKEYNLKIENVEINLNESGQIDVKIKAKEG